MRVSYSNSSPSEFKSSKFASSLPRDGPREQRKELFKLKDTDLSEYLDVNFHARELKYKSSNFNINNLQMPHSQNSPSKNKSSNSSANRSNMQSKINFKTNLQSPVHSS